MPFGISLPKGIPLPFEDKYSIDDPVPTGATQSQWIAIISLF